MDWGFMTKGREDTEAAGCGIRETVPESVEPATRSGAARLGELGLVRSLHIPRHGGNVHLQSAQPTTTQAYLGGSWFSSSHLEGAK